MKKCYIISLEVNNYQNYSALYNAIMSYGTWGKITETTWAILSNSNSAQIRDHLVNFLLYNDRILVIKAGGEAAWNNAIAQNDWLQTNLAIR